MFYRGPAGTLGQILSGGGGENLDYVGSLLATELNAGNGAVLRRYVYGPGSDEPLVWYEGTGTSDRRFLHADERGSVIAVTNDAGNALAINTYDEYGIPGSGNWGRFQYTGQKWIAELGMYDYKARMYSPTLGRFMQTDPIGYGDGLNWYAYAGADSINYTDTSGTDAKAPHFCTGSIIPSDTCSQVNFLSSNGVDTQAALLDSQLALDAVVDAVNDAVQNAPKTRDDIYQFDKLSQTDLDLLAKILNTPSVDRAISSAWSATTLYGLEESFFIYQKASDQFFPGTTFQGSSTQSGGQNEFLERIVTPFVAVANFHTHPDTGILSSYTDYPDIHFNMITNTIGIIGTAYGLEYGRTGHLVPFPR